jgi:hypothetical protein
VPTADIDQVAAALSALMVCWADRARGAAETAEVLEDALRVASAASQDGSDAARHAVIAAIWQALAESRARPSQ